MKLNELLGPIYLSHIDLGRLDRVFSASNPIPYTIMQLLSGAALIWAAFAGFDWYWWVLSFVVAQITVGIGISCGYHRYWTHNSYKASRWLENFYLILGIWTMAGSPSGFAFVHRIHHRYSDQPGDPHAPALSGWKTFSAGHGYADVSGYVETLRENPRLIFGIRRMMKDWRLRTIHNWLWLLALIPPILMGLLGLEWFLFGWLIPSAVRLWIGPFSLWYSHRRFALDSDRPHQTGDRSTNSWLIGFWLWEGPHNNHHAKPRAWSYWMTSHDYDPGTWWLKLMFRLGLASKHDKSLSA